MRELVRQAALIFAARHSLVERGQGVLSGETAPTRNGCWPRLTGECTCRRQAEAGKIARVYPRAKAGSHGDRAMDRTRRALGIVNN